MRDIKMKDLIDLRKTIGSPDTKHHYYSSLQSSEIGFIRFDNAYTYKTKRIKLSAIVDYCAYDDTNIKEYNKSYIKDLGEIGYTIDLHYSLGDSSSHIRIFFWTEQQRDETLDQLDLTLGVYEMTPQPKVTVINPSYTKIPEGSATIQDLPILD